jgi:transcriptional regulator with XRE-family HTH domain
MALKRHRLAQRRRALGYSQERLADDLGVDRSTIGRWESAETDPQPWIRPKLSERLEISLEELDELLEAVRIGHTHRDERLDYVINNPTSIDLVTLGHLRQRLHDLSDAYDRMSSALLLAAAGQYHGQVAYLRTQAPIGRLRRDLYAVEAESAILMGQLVWDASQRSDHATAVTFFDHAITAARQVRDVTMEAHAQLRKGYVELYGKRHPREGLVLAEAAARTSEGTSHALAGLSLLHVAEAHAMLGEHRPCETALAKAESHFGKVDADDAAIELFSPTQFGRLSGSCYLFRGNAEKAATILEATAQEIQPWKKSRAIVLGNLSLAYVRMRRLGEAMSKLNEAIEVVARTRGGGGLNVVFAVGRELRPWHHEREVQDLNDRLLSLMAP